MAWAQWDTENDRLLSVVSELPDAIRQDSAKQLAELGYYELQIIWPEDMIHRFPLLSGDAKFELVDDQVQQTFPNADFSVTAVREFLTKEVNRSLRQVLYVTDWYFIRKLELGIEVPEEILLLRQHQREHLAWLEEQVATLDERSLVEFQWVWPTDVSHVIVDGVRVITTTTTPPPPPPPPPVPPDPETAPITALTHPLTDTPLLEQPGFPIEAVGPTPITQPALPQPVPPTTDGPVPLIVDSTLPPTKMADNTPREVR